MISCAHPGKIGDALYTLPTIKKLSEKHNCKVDFYTSSYCNPVESLVRYQSYINDFIVPDNYVIQSFDCGGQPWEMPIDTSKYDAVYQLGFRGIPDKPIPEFIAESAGINYTQENLKIEYEYPCCQGIIDDYIVVASRGLTSFSPFFDEVMRNYKTIEIGSKSDYRGIGIDMTGLDFLKTCEILSNAKAFFGIMSSQLVLANGFNMPKIIPHDGQSWDMRHVIYSPNHHYLINPELNDVKPILGDIL